MPEEQSAEFIPKNNSNEIQKPVPQEPVSGPNIHINSESPWLKKIANTPVLPLHKDEDTETSNKKQSLHENAMTTNKTENAQVLSFRKNEADNLLAAYGLKPDILRTVTNNEGHEVLDLVINRPQDISDSKWEEVLKALYDGKFISASQYEAGLKEKPVSQ